MDPIEQFQSLPLITRSWLGFSFVLTAGVTIDFLQPSQLVLLKWDVMFQHLELWRLATCFGYCGAPLNEFGSLILLYIIYLHGTGYERNPFPSGSGSRTADTLWTFLWCMILLLATFPLVGYYFGRRYALHPILTSNLSYSIMYLWSRRNPEVQIQLNFVPIQGKYLPFAHIGLALLLQHPIQQLLHGFFVGHVYFFAVEVLPQETGGRFRLWKAPRMLVELVGDGHDVAVAEDDYHGREAPMRNDPATLQRVYQQRDGATLAHVAAKLGNLAQLQQLDGTTRGQLTAMDRNGWQPLHEAVRGGHLDCVNYLIAQQNANIHATTRQGQTPLILSRESHGNNHPVTLRLLELLANNEAGGNGSDNNNDDSN